MKQDREHFKQGKKEVLSEAEKISRVFLVKPGWQRLVQE